MDHGADVSYSSSTSGRINSRDTSGKEDNTHQLLLLLLLLLLPLLRIVEGRGGTHSMCTRQTVTKKKGLPAFTRPRLSSAQVIDEDMITRVGKHPNLVGGQWRNKSSSGVAGAASGGRSFSCCMKKRQTENRELTKKTEN